MNVLPLASLAECRIGPLDRFGFAPGLGFAALNDTEYLLSAHHLPLAVRMEGASPRLGAVLDPPFLARPQVDEEGRWQAAYLPIALRLWPFVLSPRTGRPIDEIDVFAGSTRIGKSGAPICLDPEAGTLSPDMAAIRNTLAMLRDGGARLTKALDLLRIAGVLVPLTGEGGEPSTFLSVDPTRFGALRAEAVAALGGASFLPLDLASALLFSRRNLAPERLPRADAVPAGLPAEPAAPRGDPMDFMFANLEVMDFALDGSDLFDGDEGIDWQDLAPPPPPSPLEGLRP